MITNYEEFNDSWEVLDQLQPSTEEAKRIQEEINDYVEECNRRLNNHYARLDKERG